MIDSADSVLRPILIAAIHTGMRRGEILELPWRAVDLTRKEITVEASTAKTGRKRVIPLTATLHGALSELRTSRMVTTLDGSDIVFTYPDGAPVTVDMLLKMMASALLRCTGIPKGKKPDVTFHCLRHTAASLMVQNGMSLFDVARILGHKTLAMTMRYAHFAPDAVRGSLAQFDRALTEPGALAPAQVR